MTSGLKPIGHDLFRELEIMLAMAPRNNPLLRLVSGDSQVSRSQKTSILVPAGRWRHGSACGSLTC